MNKAVVDLVIEYVLFSVMLIVATGVIIAAAIIGPARHRTVYQ